LNHNLYLGQEAVFEAAEKPTDFSKFVPLSDLLDLRTDLLLAKNKEQVKPVTPSA
jgi:hypothetical protein